MPISYQQTATTSATNANCGGIIVNSATQVVATVGGTPAASPQTVTLTASQTSAGIAKFYITPATTAVLAGGDWTVRLNVTTANSNVRIDTITICRNLSSGTNSETLGSLTGIAQTLSTTGVKTFTITTSTTNTSQIGTDFYTVTITGSNVDTMNSQAVAVQMDQLIDTSFETGSQFRQTDTTATATNFPWCSGSSATTTPVGKTAVVGGTAGTGTLSPTVTNGATTAAIYWVLSPASNLYWNSGTWTIRLDVTVANANFTASTVSICRINSSFVSQENLSSGTPLGALTATGTKTCSPIVQPATSPNAGDMIAVVIEITNTASMSTQTCSFKSDLLIDTTFATVSSGGVLASSPSESGQLLTSNQAIMRAAFR